jgi:hypothetical protein
VTLCSAISIDGPHRRRTLHRRGRGVGLGPGYDRGDCDRECATLRPGQAQHRVRCPVCLATSQGRRMRDSNPRGLAPNPLSKSANRGPRRFAVPCPAVWGGKQHGRERGRTWTTETKTETASGRTPSVGVRARRFATWRTFLTDPCPGMRQYGELRVRSVVGAVRGTLLLQSRAARTDRASHALLSSAACGSDRFGWVRARLSRGLTAQCGRP